MAIIKRIGESMTTFEWRAARAQTAFITTPNLDGAPNERGTSTQTAPSNWFQVTATGDTDWVDVTDYSGIVVQFVTNGTFTLTVSASLDGGTTFVALTPDQGSSVHPLTTGNVINTAGFYRFTGAYQYIKANVTAITGTLTASSAALQASISAPSSTVTGFTATTATAVATGAAATATMTAPGAGIFNYVTGLIIVCTSTTVAPAAAQFDVTTTGLPANMTFPLANTTATTTTFFTMAVTFPSPIKASTANSAVTLTGTPGANVRLSVILTGYTGA